MRPIRALTIWQPWASLIACGRKTVENRSWEPKGVEPGDFIAIHAGLKRDGAAWDAALRIAGDLNSCRRFESIELDIYTAPHGAIVGVATLDEVRTTARGDDPWFFGPFGWYLRDAVPFAEPIPCAGAQGLWTLAPDTLARVRRAYARAMPQQKAVAA